MYNKQITDSSFDELYSEEIQKISETHFSPVKEALLASAFLSEKTGAKILDIGSGAGKFCIIGSNNYDAHFTGVEQRETLVEESNKLKEHFQLTNVDFVNANILDIPFKEYTGFYFFNSFKENLHPEDRLDPETELSSTKYLSYTNYVKGQLSQMPNGTRIVTFYSDGNEIPETYKLQKTASEGKMKFWKKSK
jgi:SAM-dependent methyltransferase